MKPPNSAIKIILADDHSLFREGFRYMIKKEPGINLLAEAGNGEELIALVLKLNPDVVITDIKMPVLDGIEVMHRLKKLTPDIPVIGLTSYEEENLIIEMLEAGAKGYLLKSANNEEIINAIKTVSTDKSFYCSYINAKIAEMIARSSFNPYRNKERVKFNDRELLVIQLICEQLTNHEIAARIFLSKRTVENYRENILEKMGVKNVAGIVIYAVKNGLYKV